MKRTDPLLQIADRIGIPWDRIPRSYQILGKTAMVNFPVNFEVSQEEYAGQLRSSLRLWSVYESVSIEGKMRIPALRLLSGIRTEVTHEENHMRFKLDPSLVMFSKGNKRERHRLASMAKKGETVLDMFAGIGYFAIPISYHVKRVYAIDINPDSFHYLVVNARLNNIHNIVPMLGDCSEIGMKGFADRIIMGHYDSQRYLKYALDYLRDEGFLHLHALERRGRVSSLKRRFQAHEFVRKVEVRKVKSYSPSMDHVVLDISVKKT